MVVMGHDDEIGVALGGTDALQDPFRVLAMRKDGTEPWPLSPDDFNAYMRQDAERIGKLASDMGMPKQ